MFIFKNAKGLCILHAVVIIAVLLSPHAESADPIPSCSPVIGRVVSHQGVVKLKRAGNGPWLPIARLDVTVCPNDVLHTSARSRAALVVGTETVVRVDQNSTLALRSQGDFVDVELFKDENFTADQLGNACGAGYFITRLPKRFKVYTPYLNAAVEGTEFQVALACDRAELSVFEGRVSAQDLMTKTVVLASGQSTSAGAGAPDLTPVKSIVRPLDAVQWTLYFPPTAEVASDISSRSCHLLKESEKVDCLTGQAEYMLRLGRVEDAKARIDDILSLAPLSPEAHALSSIIAVVKNEKVDALRLARHAVELSDQSSRAWLAMSYALQAQFKLDEALKAVEHAARLEPKSGLVQARHAEILLSAGHTAQAEQIALSAMQTNPNESRAHTVIGFVHLAQLKTKLALEDFARAVELDSSDPFTRLGLGLALIREGKLHEGREQVEIAVALDPANSLIRSYMGKAYYEENTKERDELAAVQFEFAKKLDAKDPTPHFYDAFLLQSKNEPVAALEELRESGAKNDNRAVFRSKFLLDKDGAARSASRARIYNSLGFGQAAISEGWKSLLRDATDPSPHQFLSEFYRGLSRHEVVSDSEQYVANLLIQDGVHTRPLPLVGEGRSFVDDAFSLTPGEMEFDRLFVKRGFRLYADALGGQHSTSYDSTGLSLVEGRVSGSAAQYRFQSKSVRPNTDIFQTSPAAHVRIALNDAFSVRLEARNDFKRGGDTETVFFDQENARPDVRQTFDASTWRLASTYRFSPAAVLLGAFTYRNADVTSESPTQGIFNSEETFRSVELRQILAFGPLKLNAGVGLLRGQEHNVFSFPPFVPPTTGDSKTRHNNVYAYSSYRVSNDLEIEIGVSHDSFKDTFTQRSQTSPKLGITWNVTDSTVLRTTAYRALKRSLMSSQTLEPTMVAGFNQFYDDINATSSERYGLALDQVVSSKLLSGAEFSKRRLSIPGPPPTSTAVPFDESIGRAYLYATPSSWLVLKGEYEYRYLRGNEDGFNPARQADSKTHIVPLELRIFGDHGLQFRLRETFIRQSGRFVQDPATFTLAPGEDNFAILDAGFAWQFPRRLGWLSVEGRNLTNERFHFQDLDPEASLVSRQRIFWLRLSVNF